MRTSLRSDLVRTSLSFQSVLPPVGEPSVVRPAGAFGSPHGGKRFGTVSRVEAEHEVVWITTRRIKPGTYEDFRKAWRPSVIPEGMLRAYECYSPDRNEVVGISWWESFEARERYRLSDIEAERQRAMAQFVESESSGLYVGRELEIPRRG
jgi:hypothetical protein